MPKVKQVEKCKHPNSRKTKALVKQLKKQNVRNNKKISANIKQNLLGEKLLWFRDNLESTNEEYTPKDIEQLILKYLNRFDQEVEQIKLKHSIGNRKNRQHASREDIIRLTIKSEREEFENAGIELPDILNKMQFEMLKNWNGELRFIQNFKLRRFSTKNLQDKTQLTILEDSAGNEIQVTPNSSNDCENNMETE